MLLPLRVYFSPSVQIKKVDKTNKNKISKHKHIDQYVSHGIKHLRIFSLLFNIPNLVLMKKKFSLGRGFVKIYAI